MDINLRERVKEVLALGRLVSLGTVDDGGVWVADVLYVYDEALNIYWMSSDKVRHSKAIIANPRVAGSITIEGPAKDNFGIQFEGTGEKLDGMHLDLMTKLYMKWGRVLPGNLEMVHGHSWYKVTPTKIELIDEKNFGFKKQQVL
jgi:uncharacterized protein YhbP (UPF0306 family)